MKALPVRSDAKRAEENHHFRGEIRKAGESDCSKSRDTESETGERHDLAETAEIAENQCPGPPANFSRQRKEERDRNAMGEHEQGGTIQADDVGARDSEKDVTHVHHARITEHPIEPLLCDRNEADVNDVAQQQHDEERVPVPRALRHEREAEAQEPVEAEFF